MDKRRLKSTCFRLRSPERLESREVLSGHAFAAAFSHFGVLEHNPAAAAIGSQFAEERVGFVSAPSSGSESQDVVLAGTLSDATAGATGTVTYQSGTYHGTTETNFTVSITGATANSTLDVSVGGTLVGELTTDDSGAGTLILSSDPTSSETSLPTDFPTDIAAGTSVTVGSLSGTLAAANSTTPGGCESHGAGLSATLADSTTGATGTATYHATSTDNTPSATLKVAVTGATASSTLDVSIDGTLIGELTTDDTGAGSLTVSSPAATPVAGSTITVGTLSGTFSASDSSSGSASDRLVHFSRRR